MAENNTVSDLTVLTDSKVALHPDMQSGEFDFNADAEKLVIWLDAQGKARPDPREVRKSNTKAKKFREDGNQLYQEQQYDEALICYNESLCFARVGSIQLGVAYGNRSAVYFEQGEYEFALYNIALAKSHDYPERLMEKLLAREVNCKQRIADGHSKGTVPRPRMSINVDTNAKIPFLASRIGMNNDPKFGRGLVAERDFNPGDIILDEKIELCGLSFKLSYQNCNQCSSTFNYSLIPCPTCPFFMYCSVECRELNWKLYHRFECGVASKLCSLSCTWGLMTPRLFFYGLSQFNDDLQAMKDFCEQDVTTEPNPLDLDYTNSNRMEVFKVFHSTKPRCDPKYEPICKNNASSHYVAFLMNPVVSAIISTEAHRRFFYRTLLKYVHIVAPLISSMLYGEDHPAGTVATVGCLLNHSCDPNATRVIDAGRVKVVLLRPVRKGEQIFASYGTSWWQEMYEGGSDFDCQCVVCEQAPAGHAWHRLRGRLFPLEAVNHVRVMMKVLNSEETNFTTKLNALQQFMKRYSHLHPRSALGKLLDHYQRILTYVITEENGALDRARLQEKYVEH